MRHTASIRSGSHALTQEKPQENREIPPYVPWKTFRNFLEWLRAKMPNRVDRSVLGSMSGATQAQLLGALRFLGLITENGTPTQKLRDLIRAEGQSWKDQFGDVLREAYLDVVRDVDLDSGPYRQLAEAFDATGAQGETLRKSIAFYLLALKEAGAEVSPHFSVRGVRATSARRRKGSRSPSSQRPSDDDEVELPPPVYRSRFEILVEKFPSFDPAWPAEVQSKWFDAFARLQNLDPDGELPST